VIPRGRRGAVQRRADTVPAGVSIHLARGELRPLRLLARRLVVALAVIAMSVLAVLAQADQYVDPTGEPGVGVLDATYYVTVGLSTTGYGDIVPVTDAARLTNSLVVTPLRVLFLLALVGTTVELLTKNSRERLAVRRWERRLADHVVICGYGTKGQGAVGAMLERGVPRAQLVVVDPSPQAREEANARGLHVVLGSATRQDVLRQARVERAGRIVVCPDRDETAVLVTLTARELNPLAVIAATARERENVSLLRRSGADSVVLTSESAGHLLELATESPQLARTVADLLTTGSGMELVDREVSGDEVGRSSDGLDGPLLAVVRSGVVLRFDDPEADRLLPGDRVVYVHLAGREPSAS